VVRLDFGVLLERRKVVLVEPSLCAVCPI
jgi:hypothetical protein